MVLATKFQVPVQFVQSTPTVKLKEDPLKSSFEVFLEAEKESLEAEDIETRLNNKTKNRPPDYPDFLPLQLLIALYQILEQEPVILDDNQSWATESSLTAKQLKWALHQVSQKFNSLELQQLDPIEKTILVFKQLLEPPNQFDDLLDLVTDFADFVPTNQIDSNQDIANDSTAAEVILNKFLQDFQLRPTPETDFNSNPLIAYGLKDSDSENSKLPISSTEEFRRVILSQGSLELHESVPKEVRQVFEYLLDANKMLSIELDVDPKLVRDAKAKANQRVAILSAIKTDSVVQDLAQTLTRLSQRSADMAYGPLAKVLSYQRDPTEPFNFADDDFYAYLAEVNKEGVSISKSADKDTFFAQRQIQELFEANSFPLIANKKESVLIQKDSNSLVNKTEQKNHNSAIKKTEQSLLDSKTDLKKSFTLLTTKEPSLDGTERDNDKRDFLKTETFLPNSKETTFTPKDTSKEVLATKRLVTIKEIPELVVKRVNLSQLESEVIKLKLYPRELGEVRISLNVKSEIVNMKLEFENPLSQKTFKEQLPLLKEALESQGLQLGEFSLGTGSFNRQGTYFNRLELAEEFSYLLGNQNTNRTEQVLPKEEVVQEIRNRQDSLVDYRV